MKSSPVSTFPFTDRLRPALPLIAATALPLLLGLRVHSQGFNLMDDGLWLLGSRVVADGGQLYRDLFSIYGPARYLVLLPFFSVWGQTVLALAVCKAVVDGLAGGFGYWYTRRLGASRWAWLIPLGVMALGPVYPRYLAAAVFAAVVGGVGPNARSKRGLLLGLVWGALALFGLDMAAYGGVILLVGRVLGRSRVPVWNWLALAAGFGLILIPVWLMALLGGYAGTAWWDTIVYPATGFGSGMGRSWWRTFADGAQLGTLFNGLNTGEKLAPLGPGQGLLLGLSWRLLYLLAWGLPAAGVVTLVRRRPAGLPGSVVAPLVGLAVAGWATLLGRGDLDHLRLVGWAVLLLAAIFWGRSGKGRLGGTLAVVLFALILGPRLSEQVWLSAHRNRPSLTRWEQDRARVWLGGDRTRYLSRVLSEAGSDDPSSAVAWPAQPGLVFLLDAPLATPQATLLAGEVRDPAQVLAQLQAAPPGVVVLGRAAGLVGGVRETRALAPPLYAYLRQNYALDFSVQTPEGPFQVLHGLPGGSADLDSLSLARRLPAASQFVRTGTSPVMGPGTSVAQSVLVSDRDLSGLALLVGSPGPWPQQIDLSLAVLGTTDGRADRLLARISRQVTLRKQIQRVSLQFSPIPQSKGQLVVVDIAGNESGQSPFTVFWHQPQDPGGESSDFYPEGQAFWDHKPIGGDLFFALY